MENTTDQAQATGSHTRVSRKDSIEIGRCITGMDTAKAKHYLQQVVQKQDFVPMRRFTSDVGHRKGQPKQGVTTGKYPVKAAQEFIRLIHSAEENAKYQGLGEQLRIANVEVKKGPSFPTPKRKRAGNVQSAHITIRVQEG